MIRVFFVTFAFVLFGAAFGTYFFIGKFLFHDSLTAAFQENQSLKAQLDRLANDFADVSILSRKNDQIAARVYSSYPLNTRNEITLNMGENEGVKVKSPVLLGSSILVGSIIQISSHQSTARTIYDSRVELPVQIGRLKVSGLLRGGNEPYLALIEKEVVPGDGVFAVGAGFPYGLKVGEVGEVRPESGILREAQLKPSFTVSELREVLILK